MAVTVREIAEWISGEVIGDVDLAVTDAKPLSDAGPGDLTFLSTSAKSVPDGCAASAVLVGPDVECPGRTVIRAADPLLAFAEVVTRFRRPARDYRPGIDPRAVVHPKAIVSPDAFIDAFVVVGEEAVIGPRSRLLTGVTVGRGAKVGADCELRQNVVIGDDCVLGDRVLIQPNAVIGADGYGFVQRDGRHVKVPQLGSVEIGDDVEIGACTTVDRATFGVTRIGEGTKLDNLVLIGHNVSVGRHNLITGQVGMGGSATSGDYVVMGGQSGVGDHCDVGDGARISAQAGVVTNLPGNATYWGFPAIPDWQGKRMQVCLSQLTRMWPELKRLLRANSRPQVSDDAQREKPAA